MAYITAKDLRAVVPDEYRDAALTDQGTQPDPGLLAAVIDTACMEVDALIEGRVNLPLSNPIPSKIKTAALYIALEILFVRRGVAMPEAMDRKISWWRDWLSKVGAGDLRIEAPVAESTSSTSLSSRGSIVVRPSLTGTAGLIGAIVLLFTSVFNPARAIEPRTFSFVAPTNPLIESPDYMEWSQAESVGLRYSFPTPDNSREVRWEIADKTNLWLNMAPVRSGAVWSWNPAPTQTCLPAGRYEGRVAAYARSDTNLTFHRILAWQSIRVHAARDPQTLVYAAPLTKVPEQDPVALLALDAVRGDLDALASRSIPVSCTGGPLLKDFATPVFGPIYVPQATTSGWGVVETLPEQTVGNLVVRPQVVALREVFDVSFTNIRSSVSGGVPAITPGEHFAIGPFSCWPSIDYPTIRTGLHWTATASMGGVTGRYTVALNTYTQTFERIFPEPIQPTQRSRFVRFAPGSLRESISGSMQTRVSAAGKTNSVWSSREPWMRNTNCWAYGIDLSCQSPSNSAGGAYYAGTLVTPQHVLYASHWPAGDGLIGSVLTFVDMTNGVHQRTVTDRRSGVGHQDCSVAKLDSPLPASVVPAKILSSNDYPKLRGTNTYPEFGTTYTNTPSPYLFGLRISAANQAALPWFVNCDAPDFTTATSLTGYPHSNVVFSIQTIGGDSGTPALLSIGTNTVIAYTHHSYNVGPHIANLSTQIEAAIVDMGGSIYTNLTRVNLSGWPSYP